LKNKYPIFIPSKNRASNCITANNLFEYIYKYSDILKIVVEPQDYNSYLKYFDDENLLQIDKNDMGIAYVRQYIKDYSNKNNYKYHWQMDDDLRFKQRINGKNVKSSPIDMMVKIEDYIDKYSNIGMASFRNSVFAFAQKNNMAYNKQMVSCFILNDIIKSKYRQNTIEDTDYSMQVLTEGYCTVIFNRFLYDNPPQGKNTGGNQTHSLSENKITKCQLNLIKEWNDAFVIEMLEGKNVPSRIKPSRVWNKFEQIPLLNES